ncbi:filament-like plant protein 4 [Cinnamomum micranthum f. kanehirae]|uniref:Filament-like plant protein 4 n=1 Tax=Cinnamomum micranthum f. kanehirae TaxID=337451 RepID=A0A443NKY7_9MAGN|nr:filament-like plant protein 4 [Cinnamomum micranthum f. kanehirae]
MDLRSWPWKRKSSGKTVTAADSIVASSARFAGNPGDKDDSKNINYVKISVESYAHLTELECQVKILNENLSSAQSEMITKDNLVKQHAKVAEEAVSGWEKAEAEALALKNQLESVTQLKLAAEDRASHLDGALKECMRQIRNMKEEHDKLLEVTVTKTKQWETIKFDLEQKIVDLEQEILRASNENTAISRSLQERSHMVVKISEEKSQADLEIEFLKSRIQSCEKEISSLKYELLMVSKEFEIRNEEKNMSLRSAEVANKQNLECVKKLTKLEAECQRLRGLVRKKLPGPAALAQMKLEVENLGRDYGEAILHRSPRKNSSPLQVSPPECSLDSIQQYQREIEFLTARLLTMEEETKMLKEALSHRNSELQASRNLCAETERKLHCMEAEMQVENQKKSSLKFNVIPTEASVGQNASNPLRLTAMSKDGVEEGTCESWATGKNADTVNKADNSNHLELMDDFLEMERLAHLSNESNKVTFVSNDVTDRGVGNSEHNALVAVVNGRNLQIEQKSGLASSTKTMSALGSDSDSKRTKLAKLKSRLDIIVESRAKETDMSKILEDIKCIVQDIEDELVQHSANFIFEETRSTCSTRNQNPTPEDIGKNMDGANSSIHGSKLLTDDKQHIDSELAKAITQIHDFVVSFREDAKVIQDKCPDNHEFHRRIEEFSVSYNEALCGQISLVDFVLGLSVVFATASKIGFKMLTEKGNERENSISDCIDKVALLENVVIQHDPPNERISSEYTHVSHSSSNLEFLQEGSLGPGFELNLASNGCSKEEFERLKLEKDNMAMDLIRCNEGFENTKLQLQEMEQLLVELKLQLASTQKSNSLAETQLKCMTESYKSLENRANELETEMNLLSTKSEMLDNVLQEEKRSHQDALAKCKELEEQIQRMEKCSICSFSSAADVDIKTKQERDIAAAAEKLVECQETIFLLGRQLKALRSSPADRSSTTCSRRHQLNEDHLGKTPSVLSTQSMGSFKELDEVEMDDAAAASRRRTGGECPLIAYNIPVSPSDTEASSISSSPCHSKRQKQRSMKSTSPSSSISTPEKHRHGFSRFFMRGKNVHSDSGLKGQ